MFNPPPKTPQDYRDRAEACDHLASIGDEAGGSAALVCAAIDTKVRDEVSPDDNGPADGGGVGDRD